MEACTIALRTGMRSYGSGMPAYSVRLLLRIFAQSCRPHFTRWAEAADRASRVGRAERSRILGHAVRDSCPKAESATVAAEVLAACPPPAFLSGASPTVWSLLDAGTYAFVRALAGAGLKSRLLLNELVLQAAMTTERDR